MNNNNNNNNNICEGCLQEYDNTRDKQPKVLNCLHTYCVSCCQNIAYKNEGRIIICPLCSYETDLNNKGINSLQVNYSILRILDIKKKEELNKLTLLCENCDKQEVANWRCQNCDEGCANLCDECKFQHTQMKALRSHILIPMDEFKKSTTYTRDNFTCQKHPTELLEVYCCDCRIAVCLTCAVYDHHLHTRKTIEDGLNIESTDITQNIHDVTDVYNIYEKETNSVEGISQNLNNQNELLKQNIKNLFQELHNMLYERYSIFII